MHRQLRRPFSRLLVANRGEIAVRILRGARERGLSTVAVFSEPDRAALHVSEADESALIGPAPAAESYLRIDRIVDAAKRTGADAIHPGYGFLAENPALAEACEAAGLVFIGPPAEAMRAMGDKAEARRIAVRAGLPVIPGYDGPEQGTEKLRDHARRIGFPVLLKPSAGGGGKGMKRVSNEAELTEAIASSQREARAAFGDDRLVLERFLDPIRHVEIQVFADAHGNAIHLFERECSIQRRHQKIIEESPSPALAAETRARMGEAAVALARAVGYRGAGTVEFVLAADGSFYFLEMNTRLQVEHPVTEFVTGLDLVQLQLTEAMGHPLPPAACSATSRGSAIECRIYAEDPTNDFLPSPGRILLFREPEGPGIRLDSGVETGSEVGIHYDPILAKLVVSAETRDLAIARMQRALEETVILGVRTNLPLLRAVLAHPAFQRGDTTTGFLPHHLTQGVTRPDPSPQVFALAALAAAARPAGLGTVSDANAAPDAWTVLEGFRIGSSRPEGPGRDADGQGR